MHPLGRSNSSSGFMSSGNIESTYKIIQVPQNRMLVHSIQIISMGWFKYDVLKIWLIYRVRITDISISDSYYLNREITESFQTCIWKEGKSLLSYKKHCAVSARGRKYLCIHVQSRNLLNFNTSGNCCLWMWLACHQVRGKPKIKS